VNDSLSIVSLKLNHLDQMNYARRHYVSLGRITPIKQIPKNISKPSSAVSKWKAGLVEGSNWLIIGGGIFLLGAVGYSLMGELFDSRNEAYTQLFDDASYLIKADVQVKKRFGAPLHCSYGPRATTRNRLITGEEWRLKKKYSIVQFYVSSPSKEGFVTVRALRLKNNTLQVESIDIEDLSDSNQKSLHLVLGRKMKSRFGFGY
jgi:hypothetical protein